VTLPPGASGPKLVAGAAPVDTANNLLSIVPSSLTTSVQETPAGQRGAVTVRTVDTTLTVFLAKDEIDAWISALQNVKGKMSGLILGSLG
jgi:hypothetical protein